MKQIFAYTKEQREEDVRYWNAVEKQIQTDPQDSALKFTRGFFRLGKGRPGRGNVLFIPVNVIDGRKSFGRLQCLIAPIRVDAFRIADASLGQRWVDRKFIVLPHDSEYRLYQKYLGLDEETDTQE